MLVSLIPESEGTSSESDDNQSEENGNDASKNVSQFVIYRRSTTMDFSNNNSIHKDNDPKIWNSLQTVIKATTCIHVLKQQIEQNETQAKF